MQSSLMSSIVSSSKIATTTIPSPTTSTTLIFLESGLNTFSDGNKVMLKRNYDGKIDLSIQNVSYCNPECVFKGVIDVGVPIAQKPSLRIDADLPYSYRIYDKNMNLVPDKTFKNVDKGTIDFILVFTPGSGGVKKFSVTYVINNLYGIVEDPYAVAVNRTDFIVQGKSPYRTQDVVNWFMDTTDITTTRKVAVGASTGGPAVVWGPIACSAGYGTNVQCSYITNDTAGTANSVCLITAYNGVHATQFSFSTDGYLILTNASCAAKTNVLVYNFTGIPPQCSLVCNRSVDAGLSYSFNPVTVGDDVFVVDTAGALYSIVYKSCALNWKKTGVADSTFKTAPADSDTGIIITRNTNRWVKINTSPNNAGFNGCNFTGMDTTQLSLYGFIYGDSFYTTSKDRLYKYRISDCLNTVNFTLAGDTDDWYQFAIHNGYAWIFVNDTPYNDVVNKQKIRKFDITNNITNAVLNITPHAITSWLADWGAGIMLDENWIYVFGNNRTGGAETGFIEILKQSDGTWNQTKLLSAEYGSTPQIFINPTNKHPILGYIEYGGFKMWESAQATIVSTTTASTTSTSSSSSSSSSSTTTTTTLANSYIKSNSGNINIMPAGKLIFNTTKIQLRTPNGNWGCCGMNDSYQWSCTAGQC